MYHVNRDGERRGRKVGEKTLRKVRTEERVMRKATVVGRMGWKTGERMAQLGRWLLNGFDIVVQRIHDHVAGRSSGAISSQLFQLQALSVFTPHVHQQTVVRYAEYSASLRRRHLLVPHVLQRLG